MNAFILLGGFSIFTFALLRLLGISIFERAKVSDLLTSQFNAARTAQQPDQWNAKQKACMWDLEGDYQAQNVGAGFKVVYSFTDQGEIITETTMPNYPSSNTTYGYIAVAMKGDECNFQSCVRNTGIPDSCNNFVLEKGINGEPDLIKLYWQSKVDVLKRPQLDSAILTNAADIDAFSNLLKQELIDVMSPTPTDVRFKLLFRNSRDGNSFTNVGWNFSNSKGLSSAAAFHAKCDGHKNTVTLVKSNHGSVFGGFTTKDSATPTDHTGYTSDPHAFLYRVKSTPTPQDPKIFNLKDPAAINAVKIKSKFGPQWGNGDLMIAPVSSCHADAYQYGGIENALCGGTSESYQVDDYEVYLVESKPVS